MYLLVNQQLALPSSWLLRDMLLTKGNRRFSDSLRWAAMALQASKGKEAGTLCIQILNIAV